ncbi:MAG TPA: signal peptidase II [Rhizomicrobium sp.]|jgi:signal peptidase II|nr:signal peptidase II [Rhizomicrobium sp.]
MKKLDFAPRDWGIVAASTALLLDQGSKLVMLYALRFIDLPPSDSVPVLPFFNLVMVWNRGISYGLFPANGLLGTAVLVLFTVAVVVFLGWWLWVSTRLALTVGLGLIIGGALGNLIDRLVHGKVADFFHFYGLGYDWYVFNVADATITFGVIALLYDALLKPEVRTGNDGA